MHCRFYSAKCLRGWLSGTRKAFRGTELTVRIESPDMIQVIERVIMVHSRLVSVDEILRPQSLPFLVYTSQARVISWNRIF